MGILSWIILGLIAGALGKFIMPGKDGGGCLVTCILGIVGALLGGYLGSQFLGLGDVTGAFNIKSIGLATGGAFLVLLIYRLVLKKKA